MKIAEMIGYRVSLYVSDPWEFGTECGEGPFFGEILDIGENNILLRLQPQISFQGRILHNVKCSFRHQSEHEPEIYRNQKIASNFLFIEKKIDKLVDISNTAQGKSIPAIGSIELA